MTPETRHTRSGDAHIAFQVMGHAPLDVVLADQWSSHMELQWANLRRHGGLTCRPTW